MWKFSAIYLFIFLSFTISAQERIGVCKAPETYHDQNVFIAADTLPKYEGGMMAFMKDMRQNISIKDGENL